MHCIVSIPGERLSHRFCYLLPFTYSKSTIPQSYEIIGQGFVVINTSSYAGRIENVHDWKIALEKKPSIGDAAYRAAVYPDGWFCVRVCAITRASCHHAVAGADTYTDADSNTAADRDTYTASSSSDSRTSDDYSRRIRFGGAIGLGRAQTQR